MTARLVRDHLSALQWDEAERAARTFLSEHPERAEGHALLGEALRERWQLADAQQAFEQAKRLDATHAEAWAGLGFIQIVRGQIDDGISSCRWAIRLRSDLAAPHRYLASALLAQGQPQLAARSALEARRLGPHLPENSIILAATWFRSGLRAGASRLIDTVIAQHPGRAEAFVTRAAFCISAGKADTAAADLDRGLALKPWLAPAHGLRARLLAGAGRLDDAFASLREARRINPFSEEYLRLELDWLAASGQRAAALALIDEEWWRHPKSRDLKARAAMWQLADGQLQAALRHIPGTLPGAIAAEAWSRLAEFWLEIGDDTANEALLCLTCAATARGTRPDAGTRLSAAQLQSRLGRDREALESLDGLDGADAAVTAAEILQRLKQPDEAIARLSNAVERHPDHALAAMRLGILLRSQRRFDDAERHLSRAVALVPDEPVAVEHLGILYSDQQRFDEALAAFRRSSELSNGAVSVRLNIAVLLARQRRWSEAERTLRQIVFEDPLNVSALGKLGQVLNEQKRWPEAAEVLELTIERAPNDPGPRVALLNALRGMHQVPAAAEAARQWTIDDPGQPAAWSALARQLAALKSAEADAAADRAWALDPDTAASFEMRGEVAVQLGRHHEAHDWFNRGLAIAPDHVGLLTGRALLLQDIDSLAAAEPDMRRIMQLAPDGQHARLNFSLFLLRMGAYEEGWEHYEARDLAASPANMLLAARAAAGGALDLSQASVLVRAEQGLGDTLQFMRYVHRLASEAREVSFQLQDGLTWMAQGIAPNVRVFGRLDRLPAADFQTLLISLPRYFGTTTDTIPANVPYISADPARRARWRARIGSAGLKIGLVWHTNPAHGNTRRWIPLRCLAPLAELPGVRLISLQKHHGLDQLAALPATQHIETLGDRFDEGPEAFADAAAVIAELDLVISIDTSMAHLAGAMARPTWVVLHTADDWRWLKGRDDSPWYPTTRLFRQTHPDDWTSVGKAVLERCRAMLDGGTALWPVEPPIDRQFAGAGTSRAGF